MHETERKPKCVYINEKKDNAGYTALSTAPSKGGCEKYNLEGDKQKEGRRGARQTANSLQIIMIKRNVCRGRFCLRCAGSI